MHSIHGHNKEVRKILKQAGGELGRAKPKLEVSCEKIVYCQLDLIGLICERNTFI